MLCVLVNSFSLLKKILYVYSKLHVTYYLLLVFGSVNARARAQAMHTYVITCLLTNVLQSASKKEREREYTCLSGSLSLSLSIYIYIYTYVYKLIHIYRHAFVPVPYSEIPAPPPHLSFFVPSFLTLTLTHKYRHSSLYHRLPSGRMYKKLRSIPFLCPPLPG